MKIEKFKDREIENDAETKVYIEIRWYYREKFEEIETRGNTEIRWNKEIRLCTVEKLYKRERL